jgi:hypothetical protein
MEFEDYWVKIMKTFVQTANFQPDFRVDSLHAQDNKQWW